MPINEIQADIQAIEQNKGLYEETSFDSRVDALDYIEFNIIDRIDGLLQKPQPPAELIPLKLHAQRVKQQLEAIDAGLFERLRTDIRLGLLSGAALKDLIIAYAQPASGGSRAHDAPGYDHLDMFINGLLLTRDLPLETKEREAEMVFYQQTPARIIFELIEQAQLTQDDVLYDLGSGLGHVSILVNLLSGARSKGVEYEPAYCEYAQACAADLNLSGVTFINTDARLVDYSDGTVFFMYTPFRGAILHAVLAMLQAEARAHPIKIFTYGPCTPDIAQQKWLTCLDQNEGHIYKLGAFSSL